MSTDGMDWLRDSANTGNQSGGNQSSNNSSGSGDIKTVFNPTTGNNDTYFNGSNKADGPGHGHIRVNEQGTPSVIRASYEPGQPNARRDATELETRNNGH